MKHTPRHIKNAGVDVEVNGTDYHIEFQVGIDWQTENYGADADGNRGMRISYAESASITDIPTRVLMSNEDGSEWPEVDYHALSPEIQKAMVAAMEKEAERMAVEPDGADIRDDDGDAAYDYAKENS